MDHNAVTNDNDKQKTRTVRERILVVFDSLSPKQRRLAQYIMDHESVIAFASASDVGKETGVSAATVVRFAKRLGYTGYTDLQDHIRSTLVPRHTASQKIAERFSRGDFSHDILAHIADININNIQETFRQVSTETLNQSVAAILGAQRIRVFASGGSAAAAVAAESSLTMLGFPVRAIVNGGLSQTLEISKLNNQDVVILISIWRYLRDTIDAANHAHSVGATTIALTDSPVSPVARSADYVFVATMKSAAHSRSLTGIISLIDLINATIIAKQPQQSMQALKKIDNLYHDQGKLFGD